MNDGKEENNTAASPVDQTAQEPSVQETVPKEELDELKSAASRGTRKVIEDNKALNSELGEFKQLFDNEAKKVEQDNTYLLSLNKTNPELANKLAQEFENPNTGQTFNSINEYQNYIGNSAQPVQSNQDEVFFEKYDKYLEHKQAKQFVNTEFSKLDDDTRAIVKDKFNNLIGDKKYSQEDAKEYLEAAIYLTTSKSNQAQSKDKQVAQAANTSLGNNHQAPKPKDDTGMSDSAKELAISMGLGDKLGLNKKT